VIEQKSPYVCHVFVCTTDRRGKRRCCANSAAGELGLRLAGEVEANGWKEWVRITQSGCVGLCEGGPVVMVYPQGRWFVGVQEDDVAAIMGSIGEAVGRL
jgi:(2Fe-2S) ferredoxin